MSDPSDATPESFIDRLNRRRQRVAAEARGDELEAEAPVDEDESAAAVDPVATETEDGALSDEELLAKYELPDPETVNDEAGLDRFFDGAMPERLRQLALRRLWRLNPLFRFADEMVEYGENYTDAATMVEGMQTAYQVGKGYLKKAAEAVARVDDDETTSDPIPERGEGDAPEEMPENQAGDDATGEADRPEDSGENKHGSDAAPARDLSAPSQASEGQLEPTADLLPDSGILSHHGLVKAVETKAQSSEADARFQLEAEPDDVDKTVSEQRIKPRRMVFNRP